MSIFSSSLLGITAGGHIVLDDEIGRMYAEGGDFTSRCWLQLSQITGMRQVWNHLAATSGKVSSVSWTAGLTLQAIPLAATLVREGGVKWIFTKCDWSSGVLEYRVVKSLSTWVTDHTGTICTVATVVEGVAAFALGQVVLGVAMVTGVALLQLREQGWFYDYQVRWLEEGFIAMDVAVTLFFGSVPVKCWGLLLLVGEVQRVREHWFPSAEEENGAEIVLPNNWKAPSITDVTRELVPPQPAGKSSPFYGIFATFVSQGNPLGVRGRGLFNELDMGEVWRRERIGGNSIFGGLAECLPDLDTPVRYAHVKEGIVPNEEKMPLGRVAGRLRALLDSDPFSLIQDEVNTEIADDEVVKREEKVSEESLFIDQKAYLQTGVTRLVDGWSKGDANHGARGEERWKVTGRVLAYLTDWLEQRKGTKEAARVLLRLGLRGHACAPERIRELYTQYGYAMAGDSAAGVRMQLLVRLYLVREQIAQEWMLFINESVKQVLSNAQAMHAAALRELEGRVRNAPEGEIPALKKELAKKKRIQLALSTGPLAYRVFGGTHGVTDMHSVYSRINKLVPEFGVGQQVSEADAKYRLSALHLSLVEAAWRAVKDSFWAGFSKTVLVLTNRAINWWNPEEVVDYDELEEGVQQFTKSAAGFLDHLVRIMPALLWGSYSAKTLLGGGVEFLVGNGAIQQEKLKELILKWWKEAAGDRAETMTVRELLARTPREMKRNALFQEGWWKLYQEAILLRTEQQEQTSIRTERVIDLLKTWQMPLTKANPSETDRSSDRESVGLLLLAILGIVELG